MKTFLIMQASPSLLCTCTVSTHTGLTLTPVHTHNLHSHRPHPHPCARTHSSSPMQASYLTIHIPLLACFSTPVRKKRANHERRGKKHNGKCWQGKFHGNWRLKDSHQHDKSSTKLAFSSTLPPCDYCVRLPREMESDPESSQQRIPMEGGEGGF